MCVCKLVNFPEQPLRLLFTNRMPQFIHTNSHFITKERVKTSVNIYMRRELKHPYIYMVERGAVVEWLEQLGYGAESRRIA